VLDCHERDLLGQFGDLMDMERRLWEDEGESDSGFGVSDGDGETGMPITSVNFDLGRQSVGDGHDQAEGGKRESVG
jgi:hypothetical protein